MKLLSIILFSFFFFCTKTFSQIGVNKLTQSDEKKAAGSSEIILDLIGGGALQSSTTNSTAQSQAKGATGLALYRENDFQGSVLFNFGSNSDIDFSGKDNNGSSLLIPANGGQSIQLDFRKYDILKKISKKGKLGLNFSLTATSANWKYNDFITKADLLSGKLQLSWKFYGKKTDKLNVMLSGDFGLTYRGIFGDAANNTDIKQAIFGITKTNYWGTEFNIDLWLNDTKFFFGLPYIMGEKVKGLTSGQFVFGTAVSGTVLKNLAGN